MNSITFKKTWLGFKTTYYASHTSSPPTEKKQTTFFKKHRSKLWIMKINTCPILISKVGYILSCATSLSTITVKWCATRHLWTRRTIFYHLNLPRDNAFENTESAYDLKEMHRIVNSLPREY